MRRWKQFLCKSLPNYLENPLISAVLICDETGEDADAIESSPFANHSKIRIIRNMKRIGAYLNKRQCILESPTEWVAVLDSDNHFPESFFETIYDIWSKEGTPNPRHIYGAGQIQRVFLDSGKSENKTAHFEGKQICHKNWNEILQMPCWPYLLNDGNWILHKSAIEFLPNYIPDSETRAVDALFTLFQLIKAGWTYHVVKGLYYIHTVHNDSEWLKTEKESERILGKRLWRIESQN
jgi:glycosyltransferase involved in cell wall biosynthesis